MTKSFATFTDIDLTKEEVLECSYSVWSPYFPQNTFPSKILKPVPQLFLKYLESESIKLPSDGNVTLELNSDNEYSDWEDEEDEQKGGYISDDYVKEEITVSQFQSFHEEIIQSLDSLGGKVIPKLNWSSPKDARWIMPGNTIKCTSVNDIYLLLNASDHIVDDLESAFSAVKPIPEASEIEYELVLKEWRDVNPALEFRVFIKDDKILGISQRDLNHYDYLESIRDELNDKIQSFIYEKVIPTVGIHTILSKYIVDVYIPRPFDKVYIIDINPFSRKSDSLLFTWNELLVRDTSAIHDDDYAFRLINETNMGAFAKKAYSESQVPLDVVGASMDTEAMIELAREWNNLQVSGNISD
ncbi:CDC123 [[Candida] subhashii]|uniref:Translation initiation factor eIF2 assembly protein n=1 Tax=[Candida] subhashii TaxID=561895 RepID=A0A8J5V0E7_9ASCO|nr:CDC123 [[Candida] subhashii]KAG7665405.1 CDC123 [[Candida] subhashii]